MSADQMTPRAICGDAHRIGQHGVTQVTVFEHWAGDGHGSDSCLGPTNSPGHINRQGAARR
jgi:hypothetical protein